ncbi:MAG: molecular chaperone DnaJ [Acidimicrobiia bacterium]|nr:molecular chaperone DnaJ [Acidimicrobiia bacterium]
MNRAWVETDYYAILGVPNGAPKDEIRRAYRKLAQEFHPDANQGDEKAEERFKEVSEAYAVLSDEEKRKEYDEVRRLVGTGGYGDGAFGFPGFGGQRAGANDFEDILSGMGGLGDLFGGRDGTTQRSTRGRDVTTTVTLDLPDAINGVSKTVRLTGDTTCSHCGGAGAEPGTSPSVCTTCGGSGRTNLNQGLFSFAQPCPQCAGSGQVIPTPCTTCRGSGTERRARTISVKIPAGVEDGATVRAKGKGAPGPRGGYSGDLLIQVKVRPHDQFGRRGNHLTTRAVIGFPDAALGTQIEVPTLEDSVRVKIPAGTQPGTQFRVKGRGVPRKGDLIVTVDVEVPKKLSRKARKALADYASLTGDAVVEEEDADE